MASDSFLVISCILSMAAKLLYPSTISHYSGSIRCARCGSTAGHGHLEHSLEEALSSCSY
eukprot:5705265-Amphidinium_carterae.1